MIDTNDTNDITVTKFCHLGDKYTNGNGKITIASSLTHPEVRYGVSFCSPKDKFKKSLGCTIASNRLANSNNTLYLAKDEITHRQIMIAILCDIVGTHNYPDWAIDILLDHIDWYNNDKPINPVELHLNEIDTVMNWLNDMPECDTELLKVMVKQFIDETLS